MYPDQELARLAAHKIALQRSIVLHRNQCAEAAAQLARPIAWLDRAVAFWRRLSPLLRTAALPVGLLVTRTVFPRMKILRALVRWGPLVYGAIGGIRARVSRRKSTERPLVRRHD